MSDAPKRRRAAAPRHRGGEIPACDVPEAPSNVRVYVSMEPELHRKLVTYCAWHRVPVSALVSQAIEPLIRGFFVQHRGDRGSVGMAESPPVRLSDSPDPAEDSGQRRAG